MHATDSRPQCHVDIDADGVASVRLDNGRLNLLTGEAADTYTATLAQLARRDDVRLLVLRGGEAAFLGGADIKFLKAAGHADIDAYIRSVHALCEQLRNLPFPTLAVVKGYCLGAGMEVACVCDFKLATDDAHFGMPEVKLGVPSVIHAAMLPGMIGWPRTRDLLLTGRLIGARQAESWGLINAVASADALDAELARWRAEFLSGAPAALRLQKSLLRSWERMPLQDAIEIGIEGLVRSYDTDEPARYMQAFLDARKRRREG